VNWEAISAASEVVGATAVIVSLIYIGREIRLNTNAERAATRHAIAETIMSGPMQIVASDTLAELMHRSFSGAELKPEERLRLAGYAYATMRNWENIHYQYRAGLLNDDEWTALRLNLKFLLQVELWSSFWRQERAIFCQPFQQLVDRLLEELDQEPKLQPDSLVFQFPEK